MRESPRVNASLVNHQAQMRRVAFQLTHQRQDAEDLVQETLANLLSRRTPSRSTSGSWWPYIRTALVHQYLDGSKRQQTYHTELPDVAEDDSFETRAIDRQVLWESIAMLPASQRTALVLRYYTDLKTEEVAAAMNIAPGTARSLLSRALAGLRRDQSLDPQLQKESS